MTNTLPLEGKTIFIPRTGKQGETLSKKILQLGGSPYLVPLIEFRENQDPQNHEYLKRISQYDWVIFTSQNGVEFFFQQLNKRNKVLSSKTKIAGVGDKTKEAIEKLGFTVSFVPNFFSADDFAREFVDTEYHLKHVLIPKGNLARDTIAKSLKSRNWLVDEWIVYNTIFPSKSKQELERLLKNTRLDYALFTSPSTVHHFMEVAKEPLLAEKTKSMKMISIGPVTKKAIEDYGWTVSASPEKYTVDDMIHCLCNLNEMREER